jgi:hypothetical protein
MEYPRVNKETTWKTHRGNVGKPARKMIYPSIHPSTHPPTYLPTIHVYLIIYIIYIYIRTYGGFSISVGQFTGGYRIAIVSPKPIVNNPGDLLKAMMISG